jgi:hypothetical protein
MTRVLLALFCLAAACKKYEPTPVPPTPPAVAAPEPPPAAPDPQGGVVQPGGDEAPRLRFRILAVYPKHKPAARPPYHEPGGTWTFFDAQTLGEDPATFSAGVDDGKPMVGDIPIGFGDAQLAVADGANGARLVDALARAFGQKPPPAGAKHPRAPLKVRAALLGRGVGRGGGGGFSGTGTWVATKLFFDDGKRYAEVFFNYDPITKQGEFSEKDSDYDADLVAFVSAALRDAE